MGNEILPQAMDLGASAVLGAGAAMLYDLLRAVRIRRRRQHLLTHLLDAVYVLALALGALWMAVALGGGVLRLYMVTGAAAGALCWWLWPARALRPIWDFWLDAAADTVRLLWRPVGAFLGLWGKIPAFCKRVFPFGQKYATMEGSDLPEGGTTCGAAEKP